MRTDSKNWYRASGASETSSNPSVAPDRNATSVENDGGVVSGGCMHFPPQIMCVHVQASRGRKMNVWEQLV